ncbi:hypothetical protein WBU96_28200 [Bacillus albus]|uniref:Phage protein n=1 Tax=Bacillus cereus TIAC219 TaxID=718222 RepID=A0ABC9SQM2_BACCE|nr:hypothetical protein [Bacillus cereus]EJP81085.1 hypothetical protein IC1_06666 [Bacillus cereus VD022]EOQ57884.1 hypothetical protein IAY_06202 [Bacillus cereus TIAC219]
MRMLQVEAEVAIDKFERLQAKLIEERDKNKNRMRATAGLTSDRCREKWLDNSRELSKVSDVLDSLHALREVVEHG